MYAAEEYGIKAHMSGMQVFELSFRREKRKKIAVLLGKTMNVGRDIWVGYFWRPAGCSGGVKVSPQMVGLKIADIDRLRSGMHKTTGDTNQLYLNLF